MDTQTILDSIDELPRVNLARLNTPFEEMPRLRDAIAESMEVDVDRIPRLFIKRDDATGLAFGGNKARHMEFLFAHFIERGIDTVVNINHYDSNNARLVAAASAKTGMKYHWVAYDMIDSPVTGNMLIAHLAGAEIHRVHDIGQARSLAEKLLAEEIDHGRNATIVSDNRFFDIAGVIGFLEAGSEIDRQTQDAGLGDTPLHMWGLCGRSIAGTRLYARNTGKNWSASATAQEHHRPNTYEETYIDRSTRVANLLGLDTALEAGDVDTITGYSGQYGIPTEATFEAMHLVAKTEGIMLDPNYTGKSMSALLGEIRRGNVDPETPVVFIHSGGLPQTFAFAEEIWGWRDS